MPLVFEMNLHLFLFDLIIFNDNGVIKANTEININKKTISFDEYIDRLFNIFPTINPELEIEILKYCDNSELLLYSGIEQTRKGIAKDKTIRCIDLEVEDSDNKPAIKLSLKSKDDINSAINGIYISRLDVGQNIERFTIDKVDYALVLQPKRTYLPFEIELIDVTKISHPNTQIAKSYTSEINVLDNKTVRRQIIEMNAPLRYKGYTFYQAHYEEDPVTGIKTSVFAVVNNYGRLFPYISSIIMCIGVLLQMLVRLPRLFKK